MSYLRVQNCISSAPYFAKNILSATTPGHVYTVTVLFPGDPPTNYTCTCKGYEYKGRCHHQHEIEICGWRAQEGPEEQTDEQWDEGICPRCGNLTEETEEIDVNPE